MRGRGGRRKAIANNGGCDSDALIKITLQRNDTAQNW
jgi:hypothetical protein